MGGGGRFQVYAHTDRLPKAGELWGDARCAAVLVAPHHHAAPVARTHAALTVGVGGRREQHHAQSEDDLLCAKW